MDLSGETLAIPIRETGSKRTVLACGLAILAIDPSNINELDLLSVVMVVVLAVLMLRTLRRALMPAKLDPILIRKDSILVPDRIGSKTYRSVRYEEMENFEVRGRGKHQFLVMRSAAREYYFPSLNFESSNAWQTFIEQVLSKTVSLPDGYERITRFELRRKTAAALFGKRPKGTLVTILAVVSGFALQVLLPEIGHGSIGILTALFANSSVLVEEGQYYRLITCGLVHGGALHLILNSLAIVSLGFIIEAFFGLKRYLIIVGFSLIFGSILSVLNGVLLSVGVSSAAFGLLGALAVMNAVYGRELPVGMLLSKKWWILVIALNGILPFCITAFRIDMAAHAGGFIAGATAAALLLKKGAYRGIESGLVKMIYILIIVLVAGAVMWGALNALDPGWLIKVEFALDQAIGVRNF